MRQERKKRVAVPKTLWVMAEKDAAENGVGDGKHCSGTGGKETHESAASFCGVVLGEYSEQYGSVPRRRERKQEFFRSVLDWLKTVKTLPRGYVSMLLEEEKPVSAMWLCYSQNPVLDCSTGSGIEEILMDMMFYRKICLAA